MSGLKVLDLFSGIGGFSLGLERTGGFETVAFCEIDKKARLVLKKHWPDTPIFEDVTTLTGDQINEKIDIIVGGFPCQDISLAGKGAGLAGARSGLWYEYHRLIKEIRPSWVIAENVSALRSRGLDEVLRSLAEIGYDAEWHCIPASAVGAPHRRDRIWIVAYPRHGSGGNFGLVKAGQNTQGKWSANTSEVSGSSQQSASLAYPNSVGQRAKDGSQQSARDTAGQCFGDSSSVGSERVVADPDATGWQGRLHWWANQERQSQSGYFGCCSSVDGQPIKNWWAVEPDVGRVAHGVSGRVDRLKQLGNAVVPQIPELIGRAILASISESSR